MKGMKMGAESGTMVRKNKQILSSFSVSVPSTGDSECEGSGMNGLGIERVNIVGVRLNGPLLHVWVYSFNSQGRFRVGWKGLTEWAKPKNESAAGGGGNVFPILFYLLIVFRPIPISLGSFISLVFFYVPFYFIVVGEEALSLFCLILLPIF
jgi:hypothetical protein